MVKKKNKRVEELIERMSVEEKIGQFNMFGGSIYSQFDAAGQKSLVEEGKIGSMMYMNPKVNNDLQKANLEGGGNHAPIIFASDVIHGVYTIFPMPLAESCSWEPELARRTAEQAAYEASALGIRWTFAPMVDIYRDARWGRVVEGAGEDPFLGSLFAEARVKGFQGEDPSHIDKHHLASTLKHFAAYGFVEAGREYNRVSISSSDLQESLRPFKAGVEAGASSIMTSMNDINGIPSSANKHLLQDIVRKEWGFDGVIVSDYGNVVQTKKQGYSLDDEEAVKDCFSAGTEIDMESRLYIKHLPHLIQKKEVMPSEVDASLRHILELKDKVGLFVDPYTELSREKEELGGAKALRLAYEAALKSLVLLQNDGTLPLRPRSKMALIGSFGDDKRTMNGGWSYDYSLLDTVTIKEGLEDEELSFVPSYSDKQAIETAVLSSDVVLLAIGVPPQETGEASSMVSLDVPQEQRRCFEFLLTLGKPVVLLVLSGRPLILTPFSKRANAILYVWNLGSRGGEAVADVILGKASPSGKTTITFPRSTGQCPIYYGRYPDTRPHDPNDHYTTGYIDCEMSPLFPFGFGLSYNEYGHSSFEIDKKEFREDETISLRLTVENLGDFESDDIIEAYAHKSFSKPIRPILELVGFKKCHLLPKEKKEETIDIAVSSFLKEGYDNKGEYAIFLGEDSSSSFYRVDIRII